LFAMLPATLIIPDPAWFWPAAGVVVLAALILFWGYRAAPPGPARWVCPGLKILGLAALACCLLEPLWSAARAKPGANLFAVLADNSQSLRIKDRGASRSRGESLQQLLDSRRAGWLGAIEENFEVRRYFFDARLQTTRDFEDLTFNGRASALGSALRSLGERFQGRPLAGILLLTDGNATDVRDAPELPGLPPIYPVVIGSPEPVKDLAVQQAHATQTDFEDAPVSLQADVSTIGYAGQTIVGQVLDPSGRLVAQQSLRARGDSDPLAFRFQLRPDKPGLSFYRISVRSKDETGAAGPAGDSEEATLANNSSVVAADRGRGPYRILYVAGRPNWEFKFLNRAVQEDSQLELVGLIRVARREPKFTFLGRAGEASNPLFRGFGNQSAEEVERYDQPVLVRLNTRDSFELRGGFPKTAEELYAYQAVVVDDLEAEFFTPDQAALLQKFVSERGGGFLMLGGMESFQEGKYQRTPIGDMLPVYLDRVEQTQAHGPVRLALTREGLLQSWARLRDNEADEKARLQGMTPFQVLNRVHGVKPGASIIATAQDDAGKSFPALVAQRFGRGRTVALTVGDVWRWGQRDADAHRDMDKAWRQLMRWLVTDVPNRVDLAAERQPEDPNGAVSLRVRVRDPKFQPLDNASVSLEVQPVMVESAAQPMTNSIRLRAEPSAAEPGLYEAAYLPRATGGYKVTACVTNSAGIEVGRAEAGWTTDLAAEEFRRLTPNLALLESLARKTGGEMVRADALNQFARRVPQRPAPVMDAWAYPLWHTPAMFGFALACLLGEWGWRRWKGLP
jgi:uncharacterized membrane protein